MPVVFTQHIRTDQTKATELAEATPGLWVGGKSNRKYDA